MLVDKLEKSSPFEGEIFVGSMPTSSTLKRKVSENCIKKII